MTALISPLPIGERNNEKRKRCKDTDISIVESYLRNVWIHLKDALVAETEVPAEAGHGVPHVVLHLLLGPPLPLVAQAGVAEGLQLVVAEGSTAAPSPRLPTAGLVAARAARPVEHALQPVPQAFLLLGRIPVLRGHRVLHLHRNMAQSHQVLLAWHCLLHLWFNLHSGWWLHGYIYPVWKAARTQHG